MNTRKFYREGLEETIVGEVTNHLTRDGHTVETYTLATGEKRYFATLAGLPFCAHGETEAEAIADALWKDESRRPSREALRDEIRKSGKTRKITLNEFRVLTGACKAGAMAALKAKGLRPDPMTAFEVRDNVSREWGEKLIEILGWDET